MELLCRIHQRRCIFRVMFTIPYCSGIVSEEVKSPEFCVNDAVTFQIKVLVERKSDYELSSFKNTVLMKIAKKYPDTPDYAVDLNSKVFKLSQQLKINESSSDVSWRFVESSTNKYEYSFDLNLAVRLDSSPTFAPLYYSDLLTDFNIKCQDGKLSFHKAVLAAASKVFLENFGGKWLEENEASLDIYGLKLNTLEDFKRYIYLNLLPETGLEQLLLIAVLYEISDLEQKCMDKIAVSLNSKNAFDIAEFALENGFMELYFEVLECLALKDVKVGEIRKNLIQTVEVV